MRETPDAVDDNNMGRERTEMMGGKGGKSKEWSCLGVGIDYSVNGKLITIIRIDYLSKQIWTF